MARRSIRPSNRHDMWIIHDNTMLFCRLFYSVQWNHTLGRRDTAGHAWGRPPLAILSLYRMTRYTFLRDETYFQIVGTRPHSVDIGPLRCVASWRRLALQRRNDAASLECVENSRKFPAGRPQTELGAAASGRRTQPQPGRPERTAVTPLSRCTTRPLGHAVTPRARSVLAAHSVSR